MEREPRTVHLSTDVWERLKCAAAFEDRTISVFIERWGKTLPSCEAYSEREQHAAAAPHKPTAPFSKPTYPARRLPLQEDPAPRQIEASYDDLTHEPAEDAP